MLSFFRKPSSNGAPPISPAIVQGVRIVSPKVQAVEDSMAIWPNILQDDAISTFVNAGGEITTRNDHSWASLGGCSGEGEIVFQTHRTIADYIAVRSWLINAERRLSAWRGL